MSGKKVLMVVAPRGFRDPEYFVPKKVFLDAGLEVLTASSANPALGAEGAEQEVDYDLSDAPLDCLAVVFIGGAGAKVYFEDPSAQQLAKDYFERGRVVAAICVAPSILANAGLLSGKKATSFPSEQVNLSAKGAEFVEKSVVEDGQFVTANGPAAAQVFAEKILAKIVPPESS